MRGHIGSGGSPEKGHDSVMRIRWGGIAERGAKGGDVLPESGAVGDGL